jgi:hypothetical protein
VFRLHAQSFTLNGGRRQHQGRVRGFRSRQGDEDTSASVGGLVSPIYESTRREK